jgi:hypothetical protein
MRRRARISCLVALSCWLLLAETGCGYRNAFGGASPSGGGVRGSTSSTAVAVLRIENDSPEPWLDRIVGDAIRREVDARAGFDLVGDPDEAELWLRGRIRPLVTVSSSFSTFVAALEYAVTMQLDLEVVRGTGTVVALDPATLSETELYLASEDIEVTRTNRLEALRHLSDVLASRAADSIELLTSPIPSEPSARGRTPRERRGSEAGARGAEG